MKAQVSNLSKSNSWMVFSRVLSGYKNLQTGHQKPPRMTVNSLPHQGRLIKASNTYLYSLSKGLVGIGCFRKQSVGQIGFLKAESVSKASLVTQRKAFQDSLKESAGKLFISKLKEHKITA